MSKVTCENTKKQKHQNALNGVKKHFCRECNIPLRNASSFAKHKREIHDGLIRYNYHCKTCNVYIKDKRDALTHRNSKKHLDVLKYLYHCDVCDGNVLLNKEGMIRKHKLIHENKCNLKAVFYDEYKRTDITWVTNVKKIDGKKKKAAVVRRPVMFNKKTETNELIEETTVRQQKRNIKKEPTKVIKTFRYHFKDFMEDEQVEGLDKDEMDTIIKELASYVEYHGIEITEDDYDGDYDEDLENLDILDEDGTRAFLLELAETIYFIQTGGEETDDEDER
eukprot:gene9108-1199_t